MQLIVMSTEYLPRTFSVFPTFVSAISWIVLDKKGQKCLILEAAGIRADIYEAESGKLVSACNYFL